jgi:septal ring factor EnvC (AmiA/AmiB activator)
MAKIIKDLALALVNATLVLIAICLFLAWRLGATVDGMTATFAENLELLAPLRAEVAAMTDEITGLRGDIAALSSQTAEASDASLQALEARIAEASARLDATQGRFDQLVQAPGQMIDRVIEAAMQTGATEFSRAVNDIRGCRKPAP